MFERIVVPADLTQANREAVQMAGRLAAPNGRICLLHVIETIPGLELTEEKSFYERLEHKAATFLEELSGLLDRETVQVSAEIVYGSRARTILDEAKKLEADLIVIRSHRVSGESSDAGFGTLSYQIGILAECPVLLVK